MFLNVFKILGEVNYNYPMKWIIIVAQKLSHTSNCTLYISRFWFKLQL